MQATGALTIADVLIPRVGLLERAWARNLVLIAGFAGFVAVCAQIAVRLPWTTVPITGQTFGVLVTGASLGTWRGASSLTLYMLLAMVGIPVFAPGSSATAGTWDIHFILPWQGTASLPWELSTGGYIVGFILAAALVGYLAERGQWDRKPWVLVAMLLGNVILYIPGLLWFAYLIDSGWVHPVVGKLADYVPGSTTLEKTLIGALYPYIIGDLTKLYLASLALPTAWAVVGRVRRRGSERPE